MDNLKINQFEIRVSTPDNGDELLLIWEGIIQESNPAEFLDPFLEKTLDYSEKNSLKMICDFRKLKYMNSSSIPPLIHLLRKLSEKKIYAEFIYDKNRKIQIASFKALNVIAKKTEFVLLIGK